VRILFATFSEKTHFIGMVPTAWALRTAGHEVCVASQPALGRVVAATGLPFAPVGADHRLRDVLRFAARMGAEQTPEFDMTADPDEVAWDDLREGYRDMVLLWWKVINEPMLTDLVDLCRAWRPDLVVWEPLTFSAPIAARAAGAAHVRYLFSSDLLARMRARYLEAMADLPEAEREDPLGAWLADRADRHGVAFDEELVRGEATVDYLPPTLHLDAGRRVRRLPVRWTSYNGRAVVPEWLRRPAERPRVCLSLGTSATDRLDGYAVSVADVLDGLADLDAEVVATLPVEQQRRLGTVPGNVRLVDYVPLHALAPTCAAMISHGGAGTVLTGLADGVPQLVLPHHMYDEPLLGRMLAEQGSGLLVTEPGVDAVRAAAGRLLAEPGFARAAGRVRDEIAAMPDPAAHARTLTAVARG
jgi:glycosyltransferase (activator-dependent family)